MNFLNKLEKITTETPNLKVNVRDEWYQTESYIVVTVFFRNLKDEDLFVVYTEKCLSVEIRLPNGDHYKLHLNLAHKILPGKCSYKIMSNKLEVILIKEVNAQWYALEADGTHEFFKIIPKEDEGSSNQNPHDYPTSHPTSMDWESIERNVKNLPEGKSLQDAFFDQVYGPDSTEQDRNEMNKSFLQEGVSEMVSDFMESMSEIGAWQEHNE